MRERRQSLPKSTDLSRGVPGRKGSCKMGGTRANPRHCGKQIKRAGLAALSGADGRRSSDRQSVRKHKPQPLGCGCYDHKPSNQVNLV